MSRTEYFREYHLKNRERKSEYHRKYLLDPENKQRKREYFKQWRAKNKERLREYQRRYLEDPATRERRMLRLIKNRAKDRGIEFDLKPGDVVWNTHCPVFGIELSYGRGKFCGVNNASVDRIDNTKGYVKGNVIVVSNRANLLKRDATPQELMAVANFYAFLQDRQ